MGLSQGDIQGAREKNPPDFVFAKCERGKKTPPATPSPGGFFSRADKMSGSPENERAPKSAGKKPPRLLVGNTGGDQEAPAGATHPPGGFFFRANKQRGAL